MDAELNREKLVELHKLLKAVVDSTAFNGALAISLANELKVTIPFDIEVLNEETSRMRGALREVFADLYPKDDPHP